MKNKINYKLNDFKEVKIKILEGDILYSKKGFIYKDIKGNKFLHHKIKYLKGDTFQIEDKLYKI